MGVFIKERAENDAFGAVLDSLDAKPESVTLADLVPEDQDYFHYLGSLTTPSLTENVEWYVRSTPIEASAEQIKEFTDHVSHNNREVQDLDGRTVIEYDAP